MFLDHLHKLACNLIKFYMIFHIKKYRYQRKIIEKRLKNEIKKLREEINPSPLFDWLK